MEKPKWSASFAGFQKGLSLDKILPNGTHCLKLATSNFFFSRYVEFKKKILKNPFVGFTSPFFWSPGGENSLQKKTLHLSIERDKVVHCVRKSKEIFF
jgi:hypothetical protein